MKIVEKVLTVKPSGEFIVHPQRFIKVKFKKINKTNCLNRVIDYKLPLDLEDTINKSINLKKYSIKLRKQELDNKYLRNIINSREFLSIAIRFFKELEKIQKDNKQNIQKYEKTKLNNNTIIST